MRMPCEREVLGDQEELERWGDRRTGHGLLHGRTLTPRDGETRSLVFNDEGG
jgi:hypothetical protein